MYEKKFFIFVFIIFCLFSVGCKSTRVLSDNRIGIDDYREFQSEIRDGETKLAVSGERISNDATSITETSAEIRQSSEELGEQLNGIEITIRESENIEQELGEILQRIRERQLTENQLIELGIEF